MRDVSMRISSKLIHIGDGMVQTACGQTKRNVRMACHVRVSNIYLLKRNHI